MSLNRLNESGISPVSPIMAILGVLLPTPSRYFKNFLCILFILQLSLIKVSSVTDPSCFSVNCKKFSALCKAIGEMCVK